MSLWRIFWQGCMRKVSWLNKYLSYLVLGFKKTREYPANLFNQLFIPILIFGSLYAIWFFIFQNSSGVVNGFAFDDMILYLLVTTIFQGILFYRICIELDYLMSSGDILRYTTKPVNFLLAIFSYYIGFNLVNVIVRMFMLFFISFFVIGFVPSISYLLLFFAFIPLYVVMDGLIYSLIGLTAFWLTKTWGIRSAYEMVQWIFSGALIPIVFFPFWLQSLVKFTPFYYTMYSAASIFSQSFSISESFFVLKMLLVWIVIFSVLVWFIMRLGLKKLQVMGG